MPFSFEVPFAEVRANLDTFVDEVFRSLQSEFMELPRGPGFIEYPVFEQGYEALKRATQDFRALAADQVLATVYAVPITLIVLRTMLGFSPPEWAYVAEQRTGTGVPQGAVRGLDRRIRMDPLTPLRENGQVTAQRVRALVMAACWLLTEGVPSEIGPSRLHRLDKADTRYGLPSIQPLADLGVPMRCCCMNVSSVARLLGIAIPSANWWATSWKARSKACWSAPALVSGK